MSRMAELWQEQQEQRQAMGWDDYLAWEAAERELNEQELKEAEQDQASSTQH
jgi:hypothetical protein